MRPVGRRAFIAGQPPPGVQHGHLYPRRKLMARHAAGLVPVDPPGKPGPLLGPGRRPGRLWPERRTIARQAMGIAPLYRDDADE